METALQQKSCCLHYCPQVSFSPIASSQPQIKIWSLIERFDRCAAVHCDSALIRWRILLAVVPPKIQDFAEFDGFLIFRFLIAGQGSMIICKLKEMSAGKSLLQSSGGYRPVQCWPGILPSYWGRTQAGDMRKWGEDVRCFFWHLFFRVLVKGVWKIRKRPWLNLQVEPGKPGAEVSKRKRTIKQRNNLPLECHEKWHCNITKCCACHEQDRICL